MYFEVVGTGSITSMMIKNSIAKKINDSKKVVTDCKSSYESIAKDNNWNLIQIKSGTYTNEIGDNLANINSLHSELELFISKFRGVSTKHLQQYLDWFVFSKYQNIEMGTIRIAAGSTNAKIVLKDALKQKFSKLFLSLNLNHSFQILFALFYSLFLNHQ